MGICQLGYTAINLIGVAESEAVEDGEPLSTQFIQGNSRTLRSLCHSSGDRRHPERTLSGIGIS